MPKWALSLNWSRSGNSQRGERIGEMGSIGSSGEVEGEDGFSTLWSIALPGFYSWYFSYYSGLHIYQQEA